MAKKKSLKTALVMAIMSLVACLSMFAGTTFAWFTDSVTSSGNIIASGSLNAEMYWAKGTELPESASWTDASSGPIFNSTVWEPGYTEARHLKISNVGTLDFKYALSIKAEGVVSKLADVIDVYFADPAQQFGERAKISDDYKIGTLTQVLEGSMPVTGILKAKTNRVVTVVLKMQDSANNDYMDQSIGSSFAIELVATQVASESDSFGPNYDAGAPWLGAVDTNWYFEDPTATEYTLYSAEELAGLAAIVNGTAEAPATGLSTISDSTTVSDDFKGKTIKLGGNINLNNKAWTPIGTNPNPFRANFDGQGFTVSNLVVNNDGWAGLIGHAGKGQAINISNVNINKATINSCRMAGAVVGQLYGSIDNCHVNDVEITVIPNAVIGGHDNGDKVGGIVGWLGDNGNNRVLSNSSIKNVTLKAYRDVGGFVGYAATSTTIENCKIIEVEGANTLSIEIDQKTNYYGDKAFNAGAIYGRTDGTVTVNNNTYNEESIDITMQYIKDGIEYDKDGEGNVSLYLVPASYDKETLVVPEGVTNIGNYAFAYNNNVKIVELSSTVRTLGRGFDTSTVEKVILNEGLEVIDSRAFRSTTALKEVVISSTVNEIADNAFQKSGIKSITIPANVKTVGETAFGASLIETVIFEGDIDVQGYAFRGCPNLRTVYFKGDVEFVPSTLNGRNSMWFCNGESNNPNTSNITFYVQTEEIKGKVLKAMGAERDNTTVILMNVVDKSEDLKNAFVNGDKPDTVYVSAGTYTFPSSSISAGDVIICDKDTVFEGTSSLNVNGATVVGGNFVNEDDIAVSGTINGTFKNCVFEGSEALRWCYTTKGDTIVFENCVIKTDFRGFHFEEMNGDVTFRNCEINGFNAYGGTGTITFENCTFGHDESYYNGLNIYSNTVIKDSTFNFKSSKSNFIDMEGTDKTLNISNCVAYLDGEEADVLDFVGGSMLAQNTVIIDGFTQKKVANANELQSALDSAVDGTIINFTANINGTVVVNQKGDSVIDIVINGRGYKYDGQIQIKGNSSFNQENDDSLIIKNINFETSTASREFIWSADSSNGSLWRYAHNVTIDNCTFTASGDAVHTAVGVKFQQAYNITVKNCEGTNLHSLLQAESCGSTVTVDTCKVVNGKNGVSLNNTMNAIVKNTEIESVIYGGYGIRHKGEVDKYALTVENSTVKAFVPVLIRNMTGKDYKASFINNTLTATNVFGYQLVVSAGDWGNDDAQPSAPQGTYTLTGAESYSKNIA